MTNPFSVFGRAWRAFDDHHCTLLAAAIAYHVLFAFIPLVTLLIAVLGLIVHDPAAQQGAADRVLQLLPLQAGADNHNLILDSIRSISGQSGTLTLIGVLGLVWSSAGIFGAVRSALNVAWEVKAGRGVLAGALLDIGAVIGLGALFALSLGGTIALHTLQTTGPLSNAFSTGAGQGAIAAVGYALPALFSFVAFVLLYRYAPKVRHGVGDVMPGALFAAILFELCKHGFAWYVSHFNRYQSLYGALGGVMLFMLWTYLSSLVMLLGAEIASSSERAHGGPVPSDDAALAHSS